MISILWYSICATSRQVYRQPSRFCSRSALWLHWHGRGVARRRRARDGIVARRSRGIMSGILQGCIFLPIAETFKVPLVEVTTVFTITLWLPP
jgi:hypothetical protein